MEALKHRFEECDRCIYAPCGKDRSVYEARYCFIRFLIWNADEAAGRHKKKPRKKKKGDVTDE